MFMDDRAKKLLEFKWSAWDSHSCDRIGNYKYERIENATYVDHRTSCWRGVCWGGGSGADAPAANSRGTPKARVRIESSTWERARICKYRHIYKRKGSPEQRTNAALRGNQSGEIPTAADRKMSNELRAHHSARVCGTRHGCRSTAALLSPHYCWYIYRLIIELVCGTIMKQLGEWRAQGAGCSATLRLRLSPQRYRVCVPCRHAPMQPLPPHAQPSDVISRTHHSFCVHLSFSLALPHFARSSCLIIIIKKINIASYYYAERNQLHTP